MSRAASPAPPAGRSAAAPPPPVELDWRPAFSFAHVKVLIVCRGPIRLEALQAFERLGAQPCGMLLSEKDSVVYPQALAPELRLLGRGERVHRVPDYAAASAQDKARCVEQILQIARGGGYTHLFAGYGFMAEDHEFIQAVEQAGLGFVGPASAVVRRAGAKDAAKALARELEISVTPGLDNVTALALLAQAPAGGERAFLLELARHHGLEPSAPDLPVPALAEALLQAARARQIELVTVAQLQQETQRRVADLLREYPGRRLRLKHVAGGGGKGQRLLASAQESPQAVLEVLTESKALGAGADRNFLIELNIESTRHNEIQLLGNGQWCIALGGRDCSLQMHEQKLLEVSITEEELGAATQARQAQGQARAAQVLRQDLETLRRMEAQAQRFGQAVGLNSVSTFECIVEGARHYFMEVNTRIQVEHRVTEMVYGLRFRNPRQPEQTLRVDSLVEAMLWLAVHGAALPRPERVPRHGSGAEVRINATNDALRPHAGGVVLDWTPPLPDELRDDQGIGIRNPDTGTFMPYRLAGAYDSNVALVVAHGADREEAFRRLAEILRRIELRGADVQTNQAFHLGLLQWMLHAEPLVRPHTRFVQGYLTAVGALCQACAEVDLDAAWALLLERAGSLGATARDVLAAKATLLLRPLRRLLSQPHLLAGWVAQGLAGPDAPWSLVDGQVRWARNPLLLLRGLYRHLRWEAHPGVTAEECIWDHDAALLREGLAFYAALAERLGAPDLPWPDLCARLEGAAAPAGMSPETWAAAQAGHRGHQLGLELLALPALLGHDAGFLRMGVTPDLEVRLPDAFLEPRAMQAALLALAPPPPAASDQVVAGTGGTFYARPSPEAPPFVAVGQRVEPGEVLGLLEVMKMFNPVPAPFAGTVRALLVAAEGGAIVRKGQPLLIVEPEHPLDLSVGQAPDARQARTRELLARCLAP